MPNKKSKKQKAAFIEVKPWAGRKCSRRSSHFGPLHVGGRQEPPPLQTSDSGGVELKGDSSGVLHVSRSSASRSPVSCGALVSAAGDFKGGRGQELKAAAAAATARLQKSSDVTAGGGLQGSDLRSSSEDVGREHEAPGSFSKYCAVKERSHGSGREAAAAVISGRRCRVNAAAALPQRRNINDDQVLMPPSLCFSAPGGDPEVTGASSADRSVVPADGDSWDGVNGTAVTLLQSNVNSMTSTFNSTQDPSSPSPWHNRSLRYEAREFVPAVVNMGGNYLIARVPMAGEACNKDGSSHNEKTSLLGFEGAQPDIGNSSHIHSNNGINGLQTDEHLTLSDEHYVPDLKSNLKPLKSSDILHHNPINVMEKVSQKEVSNSPSQSEEVLAGSSLEESIAESVSTNNKDSDISDLTDLDEVSSNCSFSSGGSLGRKTQTKGPILALKNADSKEPISTLSPQDILYFDRFPSESFLINVCKAFLRTLKSKVEGGSENPLITENKESPSQISEKIKSLERLIKRFLIDLLSAAIDDSDTKPHNTPNNSSVDLQSLPRDYESPSLKVSPDLSAFSESLKNVQKDITSLKESLNNYNDFKRKNNTKVRGVPESIPTSQLRDYISSMVTYLLPETKGKKLIEKVFRIKRPVSLPSNLSSDVIVSFYPNWVRNALLAVSEEQIFLTSPYKNLAFFKDFSSGTMQKRRSLNPTTRVLQKAGIKYNWSQTSSLLVKFASKITVIQSPTEGVDFLKEIGLIHGYLSDGCSVSTPGPSHTKT